MPAVSLTAIIDFEIFVLMTMKLRLSMADKKDRLEAKLADHDLSVADAERVYERISDVLNTDKSSCFSTMKSLLGTSDPDCTSLTYRSVLWPEFNFQATGSQDGSLKSAHYRHAVPPTQKIGPPAEIQLWSIDVSEFAQHFQPLTLRYKTDLFDKFLPQYEEYEFSWAGERYGARFIWGFFVSSSQSWE